MSDLGVDVEVEAEVEQEIPILFLHEIERHYSQGEATLNILNGAELAIWAGQSVALVAPSGAGKSTLLHVAGLLEHADHGDVYIDGKATAALPDAERTRIRRNEIGFVYQSHHLLPEFTALENVFLLMLPTITETLRRVPDGHPLVTDLKSPLLLGAQGSLFIFLIVGLIAQILYLRRQGRLTTQNRSFRD